MTTTIQAQIEALESLALNIGSANTPEEWAEAVNEFQRRLQGFRAVASTAERQGYARGVADTLEHLEFHEHIDAAAGAEALQALLVDGDGAR